MQLVKYYLEILAGVLLLLLFFLIRNLLAELQPPVDVDFFPSPNETFQEWKRSNSHLLDRMRREGISLAEFFFQINNVSFRPTNLPTDERIFNVMRLNASSPFITEVSSNVRCQASFELRPYESPATTHRPSSTIFVVNLS